MKLKVLFLSTLTAALLLSSCGVTGYYSSSQYDDGIYYRPTANSRAEMIAARNLQHELDQARRDAELASCFYTDSLGNIHLRDDISYAELLYKFDLPTYRFSYNYGLWNDPWYNPWWGNWRYSNYYGYYGYYDPWYGPGWNSWGYYDPWYGPGWGGYWGYYDPWYRSAYWYDPAFRPGHHPGGGFNPGYYGGHDVAYGKRPAGNSGMYQRRTGGATAGGMRNGSASYNSNGAYIGTGGGSTYRRSSGSSTPSVSTKSTVTRSTSGTRSSSGSNYGTRTNNVYSGSATRSSGSYSSGSSYSGGGYSGGSSSSGGGFGGGSSSSGGGGGSHSGGGRR